jgi:hypothetical protein
MQRVSPSDMTDDMPNPRSLSHEELWRYAYMRLSPTKGLSYHWALAVLRALENHLDKEREALSQ